jgi:hypothetical protein
MPAIGEDSQWIFEQPGTVFPLLRPPFPIWEQTALRIELYHIPHRLKRRSKKKQNKANCYFNHRLSRSSNCRGLNQWRYLQAV